MELMEPVARDDHQLGAKLWRGSYLRESDDNSRAWPTVVVEMVLKGLKMQMIEDGNLSTVEAFASGPISEVL